MCFYNRDSLNKKNKEQENKIIGKLFTIYILSKRKSNNKTSILQSRLYGWEHYYKLRRKFYYRKNNKAQKCMKISKTLKYLII